MSFTDYYGVIYPVSMLYKLQFSVFVSVCLLFQSKVHSVTITIIIILEVYSIKSRVV